MGAWPERLVMLGCGAMGGAMLDRWLAAGLARDAVRVVNTSGTPPRDGIATATAPPTDRPPDLLVLAVKPQKLPEAAALLAGTPAPRTLLSILAGVDLATLRARVPGAAVVRAMPNLPVSLGQGVTLLYGDPVARGVAEQLAQPLGLAAWIADEAGFDAATALAGSGPGFVFRYIDALTQAAVAQGSSEAAAGRLARAAVARAGLDSARSDGDAAIVDLLTRTIAAATQRNQELAEAARVSA